VVCGVCVAFVLFDRLFPVDIEPLRQTSRVVEDAKGAWLYAATNKEDKWRFAPDPQKIDPLYLQTLISYEDKRFYSHWGVDIFAIVRAIGQFISHGSIVSGASTITMQLAKMLHPQPRTLFAKITEMIHALQLEWHYSKDEILAGYLTLTPYGGNIEGVVAGSMHYFAKPPAVLSSEEIALLVSLPQSPESNRPELHPKRSKQARDKILGVMHDKGIIDSLSFKQALDKPLPKSVKLFPRYAGHLAEQILSKTPSNTEHQKYTG